MRVKGLCVKCQSETADYEYTLLNVTYKYKTLRKTRMITSSVEGRG